MLDGKGGEPFTTIPELVFPSFDMCTPTEPKRLYGTIEEPQATIYFDTSNFIYFRVCRPGELNFRAKGTLEHAYGSYMVVSWQDQTVWEGQVVEEQQFALPIPAAGWIGVALTNNNNQLGTSRKLWLYDLAFSPVDESE